MAQALLIVWTSRFMKPDFALSLSFQGISLLHRAADGWRNVGDVSLNVPDLSTALSELRARARQIEPRGLSCKIIIPNDQIRYLSVDTGSFAGETRREMARAALQGATPYDVADLVFDLAFDGEQTKIAAVARDTLAEAEAFAREHAFEPVSFVAVPEPGAFPGEPFFGAATTVDDPDDIDPDISPVVSIGPALLADSHSSADILTADEPPIGTETEQQDVPPVAAGFTSRRGKSTETVAPPRLGGVDRFAVPPAPETADAEAAEEAQRVSADTGSPPDDSGDQATAGPLLPIRAASVTAPTLDVPELAVDTEDNAESAAPEPTVSKGPGRFFSRRKPRRPAEPARPTPTPIAIAPAPQIVTPEDETERMTIFGARDHARSIGRSRPVGLMAGIAVVAVLAVAAIWAQLSLQDGLAGLLGGSEEQSDLASLPAPNVPTVQSTSPDPLTESPATATEDTIDTARLELPEPRLLESPPTPDSEAAEDLTDTDAAVLEALSEPVTDEPPSPEQDEARYAATGIWQRAPEVPATPEIVDLANLYEVSIDRTDLAQDAVALPPMPNLETDQPPVSIPSPAAAGTSFALDAEGLVQPTPEGTMNPDGVLVYLGKPPVVPPRTPTRFETEPEEVDIRDRLATLRPRPRPTDLVEQTERTQLGGLTRAELATVRPRLRPNTDKQQEEEADETPTAQAIVVSRLPKSRPRGFENTVDRSQQQNASPSQQVAAVAAVAPATVTPKIPSSASVARQATLDNAINLRRVNLIGVYGTPSNRRALVRLPSGRYKKVKVGDSVDGGRILAIGDSELRYQKSGRNLTLKIPN